MMRQIQGSRGYYLLDGGPDVLITIGIFDSADEAFASNEKAADWVRNNVLEFPKGMPEVMIGNAVTAEVNTKARPPAGRPVRWPEIFRFKPGDSQHTHCFVHRICSARKHDCWLPFRNLLLPSLVADRPHH
jgi:hypothetical protein